MDATPPKEDQCLLLRKYPAAYQDRIGTTTVKMSREPPPCAWGYTDSLLYHHLAFPIDPEEGANTPVDEREKVSSLMYLAHASAEPDACRNQIYVRDCYGPYYQIATFLSTARTPRVECGFSQEKIMQILLDTAPSSSPPPTAFRTSGDGQRDGDAIPPRKRRTQAEYLRRRSIRNDSNGGHLQHRE